MSTGKLCNAKIKISQSVNSKNTIEVECDNYDGHEGDHSHMFYHCKKRPNDNIFTDNYRLGRITWQDELNDTTPTLSGFDKANVWK